MQRPPSELISEMQVRDELFDLYQQSDTGHLFGIARTGDRCWVVEQKSDGAVVHSTTFIAAIGKLAGKLKAGYASAGQRLYFSVLTSQFSIEHPDMQWRGVPWVIAATPRDMDGAIEAVRVRAWSLPNVVIFREEIDQWVERQKLNIRHVVAYQDHPIWALLVAEVAYEYGWLLRESGIAPALPSSRPSASIKDWRDWGDGVFSKSSLIDSQRALGWTSEQRAHSGMEFSMEDNLSAFI